MAIANPAPSKTKDIETPRIEATSVMTFARDCKSQTIYIDEAAERQLIALPAGAVALLRQVLATIADGKGITLVPMHAELTPEEAADMLFVSRSYLEDLLDAEEIPYRQDRSVRWVRMDDLMAYKMIKDRESRAAMDELVALSEELGLYD